MAVGGARQGVGGRRYRAITGDVGRLKLLVELLPTTFCHWLELYGIQEARGVRGPLGSTQFSEDKVEILDAGVQRLGGLFIAWEL